MAFVLSLSSLIIYTVCETHTLYGVIIEGRMGFVSHMGVSIRRNIFVLYF